MKPGSGIEVEGERAAGFEVNFAALIESSDDPIWAVGLDFGVFVINRAAQRILKSGLGFEVAAGARPVDLVDAAEAAIWNGFYERALVEFRKKGGALFWGLMSASLIELDGFPCVLSVTRDISESKVAEEEIRNLAFYDPLTHLPNRRLLLERLRQTIASGSRSGRKRALLFIDLDDFKTLNDTLGHHTGDLLLGDAANRMAGCTRGSCDAGSGYRRRDSGCAQRTVPIGGP